MIKDVGDIKPTTTTTKATTVQKNALYRVKPGPLKSYLQERNALLPGGLTIMDVILSLVKSTIVKGKHFDESNPEIVMCSQQLENIFGMKAFHLEQLVPALVKSLVPVRDEADSGRQSPGVSMEDLAVVPPTECQPTTSKPAIISKDKLYVMSAKLNWLLLPSSPNKVVTFKEVADLLSKYIIARKDHLFDARNILVALVEKDPLGEVFGVKAFHRKQTSYLISKQLQPITIEEKKPAVSSSPPVEVINEVRRITIAELCAAKVGEEACGGRRSPKRCADSMDESELPVKKRLVRHTI